MATVSFDAPIRPIGPPRLLPPWAVTTARSMLFAQGVIAVLVAILAATLRIVSRNCQPNTFCEFGDAFVGICVLLTVWFGIAAAVAAWWLRRERLHGVVAFGLAFAATGGGALAVLCIWSALTRDGSPYSLDSYQLWAAWPLVAWPGTGVTATVVMGFVFSKRLSIVAGIAWPVACAVLSVFFLTYLLPADDAHVAGLHGLGVVRLPTSAGVISTSGGWVVLTRDQDPLIFVNLGYDGYIVTLITGDYTVYEQCTSPPAPDAYVPVHVNPGGVAVVPDRCP